MMWEIPVWMVLALAGAVGQMFRVCQGVYKAVERGEEIKSGRILSTILFAGFTGAMTGFFYPDWRASFLAGYAATDFVEGIVKGVSEYKVKEEKKKGK